MLDGLSTAGLLLLIANATASLVVRGDRSLPNLASVVWRLPSLALVVVELVDLFKGHVLGLVDKEPDEHQRDPSEASPDPEDVRLSRVKRVGQVWRDERQQPVEEPICSCGHRQTLGTVLEWEKLASDDPRSRSESRCEE